ncbi:MAG: Gfo/Idh/MocA family oxidoreductase [Candidatus Latescibacteria bacterium]|jgi:predicted dehydrogenase|nr:Gfo/Idh/MocA family oxidoreductase [Candidatus Latescibacterota bacterium]
MGERATLLTEPYARANTDVVPNATIRTAVVGLGHRAIGNAIQKIIRYDDYELAAICDIRPELVEQVSSRLETEHGVSVPAYTDFDEMLRDTEMDAVAVHVDPDVQVPLCCRAMQAGLHVLSEVPVAYTMEHCWDLVTTVECTGKVYLLMEQCRYWGFIRAWGEIVRSGVIGKPIYVEGEYVGYYGTHQLFQDDQGRNYTVEQARENPQAKPTWRHRSQPIYYLPHTLSPLLYVLDDRVARVVAMSTRNRSYRYEEVERADIQLALLHTDDDVVIKVARGSNTPVMKRGGTAHHWFHIKGTEGALEWPRSELDKPKMWISGWQMSSPVEMPWTTARTDAPQFAAGSGHGDADFYVFAQFADAVLRGVPLELDVYGAVDTAAPAILAAESILEENRPYDVPDFRPGANRALGCRPEGSPS